jgi:transposase
MSKKGIEYAKDLKLSAVSRMLAGTNVSELARELGVKRKRLYAWCAAFRARGPDGMRGPGRPRKTASDPPRASAGPPAKASVAMADGAAAQRRIAELERKVGQQALELDFFRRALRQVEASRRPSDGPGATASTPSSRRRRSGKAN